MHCPVFGVHYILYFYPSEVSQKDLEWLSYDAKICWIEIQKDYDKFEKFMRNVITLIDGDCPGYSQNCNWCKYIQTARTLGHKISHR